MFLKNLLQEARQAPANDARNQKKEGRRARPDHTQVAAYVPAELYRDVKVRLLQEQKNRNFSQLIEDLLRAYLANQIIS